MKTILGISLLLLLSACATGDGFVDDQIHQCEPGDPIELAAGVLEPDPSPDGRLTVLVEVANNSNEDVTVQQVRVDPYSMMNGERQPLDFQGGARTVNREIKEGEDETFEVPVTVRLRDAMNMGGPSRGTTYAVDATVTVKLANGDASRCRFRMPVRF